MAKIRSLVFSEGVSVTSPATDFIDSAGLNSYASTAAYITAKGTGAEEGDMFANTTTHTIFYYNGSAWTDLVDTSSVQTINGAKTFSHIIGSDTALFTSTTEASSTGTGAVVISGGVGISKNLHVGGDLVVQGATVTMNTATMTVEDPNIALNQGGNQAAANSGKAGFSVVMSDSTTVVLGYDSTLASKFKAGETGSEIELANVSSAQTFTNKTIDGDDNTLSDIALTSLKTVSASKFITSDASGVIVASVNYSTMPTGTIVGTTDTQTLTNKTFDDALTVKQIATPSNPSAGYQKVYVKADNNLYTLDSSGAERQAGGGGGIAAWATGTAYDEADLVLYTDNKIYKAMSGHTSDSSSFNTDLVGNKWDMVSEETSPDIVWNDFEYDVSAIGTYVDAAGSAPVDAAGGTGSYLTFTKNSTTPLHGTADLKISKSANDAQGYGAHYAFTLEKGHFASIINVEFSYLTSAAYADGDIGVFLYDVTNSALIYPADQRLMATSLSNKATYQFQTSATGTSYKLVFHVASTNASAYDVNIDNLSINKRPVVKGASEVYLGALTTTGSWSANTTYVGKYWRKGDSLKGKIKIDLAGAPDAAVLSVNLPSGYQIDTNKINGTAGDQIPLSGSVCKIYDFTGSSYVGVAAAISATAFRVLQIDGSSNLGNITQATPITFAASDYITVDYEVPISGWSSNQILSEDSGNRIIQASAARSGDQTITAGGYVEVVNNSLRSDTTGSYSTTTGRFTAPESGWYFARYSNAITMGATAASVIQSLMYINGTGTAYGFSTLDSLANNKIYTLNGSDTVYLTKGQYISPFAYSGTQNVIVGSATATFSVQKVPSPQTIAASEKVYAYYSSDSGQTLVNGSTQTLIFEDKTEDSHNAYNTSTGVYTVPRSGHMSIDCLIWFASAATWAAGESCLLEVFVGSTEIGLENYRMHATINPFYFNISGSLTNYPVTKGQLVTIKATQGSGGDLPLGAAGTGYLNRFSLKID